jgi:2-dehydro-3-deoxyphosphogalactonate aldolase
MRDHTDRFNQAFKALPLVASLRGLVAQDAVAIGQALGSEGWRLVDVAMSSAQASASIERLVKTFPELVVGAGEVMSMADVRAARMAGVSFVASPHTDAGVIRTARDLGLACVAGVATMTEAFTALAAGATALQLYPAEMMSAAAVKAFRSLLPPSLPLLVGGGVSLESVGDYVTAGASGFAVGAALYRPGDSAGAVTVAAGVFATALEATGLLTTSSRL